jgi:hypothetical protein
MQARQRSALTSMTSKMVLVFVFRRYTQCFQESSIACPELTLCSFLTRVHSCTMLTHLQHDHPSVHDGRS